MRSATRNFVASSSAQTSIFCDLGTKDSSGLSVFCSCNINSWANRSTSARKSIAGVGGPHSLVTRLLFNRS